VPRLSLSLIQSCSRRRERSRGRTVPQGGLRRANCCRWLLAAEYHYADRFNYAVAGTPNRLEYDQGFFVLGAHQK